MSHIVVGLPKSKYKVVDNGDELVVVCVQQACSRDIHDLKPNQEVELKENDSQ